MYVGKSFNTLEAAVRRCSIKKLFLKILQYLQENTFVGVSFNKIAGLADLLKRDFNTGVFMFIVFLCFYVHGCFYVYCETPILKNICAKLPLLVFKALVKDTLKFNPWFVSFLSRVRKISVIKV